MWNVAKTFFRLHSSLQYCRKMRFIHKSWKLLGDPTKVLMPALSPTMTEGTIIKWHKKEGDAIVPGDVLCDIQTDKAVVSFELEEPGILAKILKPGDSKDVKIGTLIALLVEEGEDWRNITAPADVGGQPEQVQMKQATEKLVSQPPVQHAEKHRAQTEHGLGPAVRALLEVYKLSANDVKGTGPHGKLLKGDVLKFISEKKLERAPAPSPALPPAVPDKGPVVATSPPKPAALAPSAKQSSTQLVGEAYIDIPLSSMRKTIAKRLTQSKTTIPHSYSTSECDLGEIVKLRKKFAADGIKLSVNDFVIKASGLALQQLPQVNAMWTDEDVALLSNIDISVAVATDNGLITPIVKNVPGLGLSEISSTVKELATRARAGRLKLDEFQGGTFTISNLGMFGISEFSAVINPPQSCILAIGSSRRVPNFDADDAMTVTASSRTVMTVTLSSDARVVDDALAASFLDAFKRIVENPTILLAGKQTTSDGYMKALFAK